MESDQYLQYHQKRFDYLFELVTEVRPDPACKVLDIGPGPFTEMLRGHYSDVSSLGFEETAIFKKDSDRPGQHIVFDLTHAMQRDKWIELPKFDLIVFSEVIEHLNAEPVPVLSFLASGLKPGGVLVCQTPNAVALHKRLAMLMGKPSFNRWRSGHVTEFTKPELEAFGEQAGLSIVRHEFRNYFGYDGSGARKAVLRLFDALTQLYPRLRRGQTILFSPR